MNDLKGWGEAIQKMSEDRRKEDSEFNAKLREPDGVLNICEGYTYGYWSIPNGVCRMRLRKNGDYDPASFRLYKVMELDMLRKTSNVAPVDMVEEE